MDIQNLTQSDLSLITDLQPAEWPDIMPSIKSYIHSPVCFPIKVVLDNEIAGIGTSILHLDTAWLAHIIVHPNLRKKGIGNLITQTLVDRLKEKGYKTIYLIATDLGAPVYEKIGFETETEYLFFKDIKTQPNLSIPENTVEIKENFIAQIAELDLQISGEHRMIQIEQHLLNGYVYLKRNQVEGFYLPDLGEGLIEAVTVSAGLELLKLRLIRNRKAVFPVNNLAATEFMNQNNNKEFRSAKRMRLGLKRNMQPENLYNRIGGNLG